MSSPHDNSSQFYEFVYQQSFGVHYNSLTNNTIEQIQQFCKSGNIIDFGAGTGRLAIPLSKKGYHITAIEQSLGMRNEMLNNASIQQITFPIYSSLDEMDTAGNQDLCIAVFTVLAYIIKKSDLQDVFKKISHQLKIGGYFFFDLANQSAFTQPGTMNRKLPDLNRHVSISRTDSEAVFEFNETCSGIMNNQQFTYHEDFLIKFWQYNEINEMLINAGMKDTGKSFPQFSGTGAEYKLYEKVI